MTVFKPFHASRRELFVLLGASAATIAVPVLAQTGSDAGKRLRALLERSDAADALLDPIAESRKDKGARGPVFVDPLGDAYAAALKANKTAEWNELQAIDRAGLSPIDKIAYDVFAYRLRQTLELFETGLFEVQRKAPFNPSFGLQVEFPDFVSGGPAPSPRWRIMSAGSSGSTVLPAISAMPSPRRSVGLPTAIASRAS
jgi:uncharacterized protein (DUF885 family)